MWTKLGVDERWDSGDLHQIDELDILAISWLNHQGKHNNLKNNAAKKNSWRTRGYGACTPSWCCSSCPAPHRRSQSHATRRSRHRPGSRAPPIRRAHSALRPAAASLGLAPLRGTDKPRRCRRCPGLWRRESAEADAGRRRHGNETAERERRRPSESRV